MPIFLAQPIIYGGERLHTAPLPPRRRTQRPRVLSLRTLNICDGQGSGLAQSIREVQISGFYLMILMETNITN